MLEPNGPLGRGFKTAELQLLSPVLAGGSLFWWLSHNWVIQRCTLGQLRFTGTVSPGSIISAHIHIPKSTSTVPVNEEMLKVNPSKFLPFPLSHPPSRPPRFFTRGRLRERRSQSHPVPSEFPVSKVREPQRKGTSTMITHGFRHHSGPQWISVFFG